MTVCDVLSHNCRCLNKADDEPKPKAPSKPLPPVAAPVQPSKPKKASCKLEVPPKLVFSMLKDRELASKLRALRLPTDGKRQVGAWSAGRPIWPLRCPLLRPHANPFELPDACYQCAITDDIVALGDVHTLAL